MADDGGASRAIPARDEVASPSDRRGPLRPQRLQSARARVSVAAVPRLFQFGDVAGLLIAGAIVQTRGGASTAFLEVLGASVAALLVLIASGAYRCGAREPQWRRQIRVAAAVVAGIAAALTMSALQGLRLPAGFVPEWGLAATVVLATLHVAWSQVLRRLRKGGFLTPNLIIVGATEAAVQLIRRTLSTRDAHILGIFDDRKDRVGPSVAGVPVLGTTADLVGNRVLPFVDRIIITVPEEARARVAQLLERMAPIPNAITLLVEEPGNTEGTAAAANRIAEIDLMQLSGPRSRRGNQLAKRGFDIVVGGVALLMLIPLMALVAIAVRLDSPGPIFFRQRRHGYMNEEIVVWKFRSMRTDATDPTASRQVTAGDARVTRVGRFIRKTSLDELPQLINVLSGEMSLVGPRPHAIGMLAGGADASKLVESYAHRHRIKPGLTGWAAVNGSRGAADSAEAIRRRVALDLEYVERQSILFDLAIMLKTAPCLLGDRQTVR